MRAATILGALICLLAAGCKGEGGGGEGGGRSGEDLAPRALQASTDVAEAVVLRWEAPAGGAPAGYRIERDGAEVARLPGDAREWRDETATAGAIGAVRGLAATQGASDGVHLSWQAPTGTPGASHAYRLIAFGGGAEGAAEAAGARAAPGPSELAILRDGVEVAVVDGSASTWTDEEAAPGETGRPQRLAAAGSEGAVRLTWDPPKPSGTTHTYRVASRAAGSSDVLSEEAAGFRGGPQVEGYVVFRDGEEIARVAEGVLAYEDTDAAAGSVAAPTNLVASQGTRIDAVELQWEHAQTSAGAEHAYRVAPLHGGAPGAFADEVRGARSAPQVTGYEIRRDGEEAYVVAAHLRSANDKEAPAGVLSPPNLEAAGEADAVALRWSASSPTPGAATTYTVAARHAGGTGPASEPATGFRAAPALTGYRILRDGAELAAVPPEETTWRDESALAAELGPIENVRASDDLADGVLIEWDPPVAIPGSAHSYVVVPSQSDGAGVPSEAAEAGRIPREITGYTIWVGNLRDGTADADATTYFFERPFGFLLPDVYFDVSQGTRSDGVELTWTVMGTPAREGPYLIEVAPLFGEEVGEKSAPVEGWREGNITGFEIKRDDVVVATLPADASSWLDSGATDVGRPLHFTGTHGAYPDAVVLNWDPPVDAAAHEYQVLAMGGQARATRSPRQGYRQASPPLGYEISREDGPWIPLGDVTTWADTEAPLGTITGWLDARLRHPTTHLDLKMGTSFTVQDPPSTSYRLRAIGAQGPGPVAIASGRRAVVEDITAVLERSDDPAGPWTPVATARSWNGPAAIPLGQAAYFRATLTAPGAEGVTGVERVSNLPFLEVATGSTLACGVTAEDVRCWGRFQTSQGALYDSAPDFPGAVAVAVGHNYVCALDAAGARTCDRGGGTYAPIPDNVPLAALSVGKDMMCGLKLSDQRAICAGSTNINGQLSPPSSQFLDLAVGERWGCGITTGQSILCWGNGAPIPPADGTWASLAIGVPVNWNDSESACALATDGTVNCWDLGGDLPSPPSGAFTHLRVGTKRACGLRPGGAIECWGSTSGTPAPTTGTWVDVDTHADYACGVRDDGTIECWGSNVPVAVPL